MYANLVLCMFYKALILLVQYVIGLDPICTSVHGYYLLFFIYLQQPFKINMADFCNEQSKCCSFVFA